MMENREEVAEQRYAVIDLGPVVGNGQRQVADGALAGGEVLTAIGEQQLQEAQQGGNVGTLGIGQLVVVGVVGRQVEGVEVDRAARRESDVLTVQVIAERAVLLQLLGVDDHHTTAAKKGGDVVGAGRAAGRVGEQEAADKELEQKALALADASEDDTVGVAEWRVGEEVDAHRRSGRRTAARAIWRAVVATEAWPRVACTRWIRAPRSSACVA
jgi:hypothetical protein